MINSVVRDILLNDTDISAITGKVYPVLAPQSESTPFIIYRRYRKNPSEYKGYAGSEYMTERGIEISIMSENYDQAESLAELVEAAMLSYKGQSHGLNIKQGTQLESEEDFFSETYDAFQIVQEYTISYEKIL